MRSSWLLALVCFSAFSACSWLVDPASQQVRCATADDGTDPCESGFACVNGACIAKCVLIEGDPDPCPRGERCAQGVCKAGCKEQDDCGDQIDNDCDGNTDEGHDPDGDGRTWCGDLSPPKGGPNADCDEKDPTRYGGAKEVCDGIDNDCDDTTDETNDGKALCKAGEECLGQHCVVPSCAVPEAVDKACSANEMCEVESRTCGPTLCDKLCNQPGQYCDQATGECRTVRKDNGEACAAHGDCLSGSCIASAALRLAISSPRVCMQTCCSDSDCGDGERCFAAGTGARSCLPASKVPPAQGASALCTEDSQCATGQSCGVVAGQVILGDFADERTNLTTSVCRTITSTERPLGEDCERGADCRSKACVLAAFDVFPPQFVCSQACRSSADCVDLSALVDDERRRSYCKFIAPGGRAGSDYVPVCMISDGETGTGDIGARCSSGASCLDGACVGAAGSTSGFCAPTCCNDSQCERSGETLTHCRIVAFGGEHYETRCVP